MHPLPPPSPRLQLHPTAPDAREPLVTDWYWEQDAQFRYSRIVPPPGERADRAWPVLGGTRWGRAGAQPLSTSWEEHRAVLEARLPFHDFQFAVPVPGGGNKVLSISGVPRYDADGSFLGYRGTARNITAQWRERSELQGAQALLQVAATLGRFAAWSVDVATGAVHWTDGLRAIQQVSEPQSGGELDVLEIYAPEHRGLLARAYQRCATEGVPYDLEVEALTPTQERFWVRVIGVAVRDASGRIVRVQGAYQDIQQSKAAAEKHRRLAGGLRSTLDSLLDGFATVDRDWRVSYVNPAAATIVRMRVQDALGRCLWELLPELPGSVFEDNYRRAMERREVRRFEAFYAPLGLWVRACAFPSGDGIGISFTDITASMQAREQLERVNAELERRVQERTAELERINEELTALTMAVAHDLRAPLAGIAGFGQALADRLPQQPDPKVAHYLARIRANAARMEEQLGGLLELSRIGCTELRPRALDLSAAARECVESLRAQTARRDAIVQVQEGLAAHGDPTLLHTLLENLIGNAWKFTAGCTPPRIEVGQQADGAFFVRDNGPGFDMERASELFAPFSRLHDAGEFPGIGIGLASARRVVERHGGWIWAASRPGEGTVFRFVLPGAT